MTIHRQWMHSRYVDDGFTDAVIVKERVFDSESENTTGQGYRSLQKDKNTGDWVVTFTPYKHDTKSVLSFIREPKRPLWYTKPEFRNHQSKKECEDINKLEQYIVPQRDLLNKLKELQGIFANKRMSLKKLCRDPYVYGADIDVEVLVRNHYSTNLPEEKQLPHPQTGMLDIETSVSGDGQINLITYTHENLVYTAVLDSFLFKYEDGKRVKAYLSDVQKHTAQHLKFYTENYGFELNFYIGSSELDIITWIFSKIHEHKTDFIGIWNIGFDIPEIMKRIEYHRSSPEKIMCSPDVPHNFKYATYRPDRKDISNFAEKWHWFDCPSHTQFIDSMCLYARIRKVKGAEPSYSLDAIADKELGFGKLELTKQEGHAVMQEYRFLDYIVYNIVDVLLLQLMEWKNHDITALLNLTGKSRLADYNKQTVFLKNDFYFYCRAMNKVPASASDKMVRDWDDRMPKAGGAVLVPSLAKDVGLKAIESAPFETMVHVFVADADVSSMYPNTTRTCNIDKETRLSTIMSIDDLLPGEQERICDMCTGMKENAVLICKELFGMPGYVEMEKALNKYKTNKMRK